MKKITAPRNVTGRSSAQDTGAVTKMRFRGVTRADVGTAVTFNLFALGGVAPQALSSIDGRASFAFDSYRYFRVRSAKIRGFWANTNGIRVGATGYLLCWLPSGVAAPLTYDEVETPHCVLHPDTLATGAYAPVTPWFHRPRGTNLLPWLITKADAAGQELWQDGSFQLVGLAGQTAGDFWWFEYDCEVEFKTPADPILLYKELKLYREEFGPLTRKPQPTANAQGGVRSTEQRSAQTATSSASDPLRGSDVEVAVCPHCVQMLRH